MASSDIQFTGDIRIDTKEAEKSIANLSRQIDNVFSKTSNMMASAIKTNSFGFSQYTGNYKAGIGALADMIQGFVPVLPAKPTKAQKAAYAARMKSVEEVGRHLSRLNQLSRFMENLSQYDNLYEDIVGLRKSVVGGTIDSEKALGRYNVKQRFSNNLLNTLYAYRRMFPDVVTEDVLEIGEKHRDRNRKTGSQSRSELRYTQDKEYWKKAYERAANYMLLDKDDTLLNQLSEIYDFDLTPSVSRKPSTVNQKAKDFVTAWAEAGISAQRHKEALEGGNLSKADKAYHFAGYKKDMAEFIRLQKKLFPEEKSIAENLKKLNQADILRFKDGGNKGLLSVLGGALGAQGIISMVNGAEQMMESYWGQSISRNAYDRRLALYNRWKIGGGVAGGIATGAAVGAATGSWTGPGAIISGAIGAIVGAIYGIYESIHTKADIRSSGDMMARIRNKSLYGSSYNTYFAKAMTDMGMANGEAAMSGLADRSMSMRGRMMLGQVGEQEMLYMSMMPNYYAALMGGVTGPELMRIYKNDLAAIGDPSMQYLVGQAIGNTEAYAAAQNPYFNAFYNATSSRVSRYETRLSGLEGGFVAGRLKATKDTLAQDYEEIGRTARRGNKLFYQDGQSNASYLDEILEAGRKGDKFTIVVNIDGEEIKRESKTADQVYVNDLQMYSVGG